MEAREQVLIDWEKSSRCAAALERHCRLAGLTEGDTALLLVMNAYGDVDERGVSFWHYSVRQVVDLSERLCSEYRRLGDASTEDGRRWLQLASQAKLTAGTVTKAIKRLGKDREAKGLLPLVLYEDSLDGVRKAKRLSVSWRRVWALETWGASGRFQALPAYQEQETDINLPDPEPNQVQYGTGSGGSEALGEDPLGTLAQDHAAQVDRLAKRILKAVRHVEGRSGVREEDRLTWSAARRIADGVCCACDSGTADELERVFGSLERQHSFRRSPAAYLTQCAIRRGWLEPAKRSACQA